MTRHWEGLLYPGRLSGDAEEEVDWARVEGELAKSGVTLKLLWEEWRAGHPDGMSYATWWRRYRDWRPGGGATLRQNRRPGERLFVDYSGRKVCLQAGDRSHAEIFVAAMGVSGLVYAEASLTQSTEDWCASHIRCFEAMGLAPRIAVSDNLKAAVVKPCRHEPVLNGIYSDLLEHYGVQGLPARSYKPRDKSLVENSVRLAKQRILAPLRDRVFHDLTSLNRAIAAEVEKINLRPYSDGSGEARNGRFAGVDAPHMQALPAKRWQMVHWRKNKVHPDCHISVERRLYSVPYQYIGKVVDVRVQGKKLDVFCRNELIASHALESGRRKTVTLREHMPESHKRSAVEAVRRRLEDRGRETGPNVHAFLVMLMEGKRAPELGFRPCYGVLRLAEEYGGERLDGACRYGLDLGTKTWRGLGNILRSGADLTSEDPQASADPIIHCNIRGAEYCQ